MSLLLRNLLLMTIQKIRIAFNFYAYEKLFKIFERSLNLTFLITSLDCFTLIILMFTGCYADQNFGKAIFEIDFERNERHALCAGFLSKLNDLLL